MPEMKLKIHHLGGSHQMKRNRQIQINYTIFPPHFFEAALVRKERLTIQSAAERLKRCRELFMSVQQR
jgi:hypothetical protein